MAPAVKLPPFAPFPSTEWIVLCASNDWTTWVEAWVSLTEAHLALPDADFARVSLRDQSLPEFLTSFLRERAVAPQAGLGVETLTRCVFLLTSRCLRADHPPPSLLNWEFLSHLARLYGKKRSAALLSRLARPSLDAVDASLAALKKFLVQNLDAGVHGDLKGTQDRLVGVNFLVHALPHAAGFLLAGSDFVDGLITCFRVMNPPLRRILVATAYLCLAGLTEGDAPKYSMLSDQLFSLRAAAEAHRAGPLSAGDSLVAELVSTTPLLAHLQRRLDAAGLADAPVHRADKMLRELRAYRRPGGMRPTRAPARRRVDKGKAAERPEDIEREVHVHKLSQITQVQDLFPELGSGFVAKLLDAYNDDAEQVVAHLLEDNLPASLRGADRSESLPPPSGHHDPRAPTASAEAATAPAPSASSAPSQVPIRRNVFDGDELDRLTADASRLHFGKRDPDKTADDVLGEPSTAGGKAAILAALAAFDSDDDERDDTYDADDVGGAVDGSEAGDDVQASNDELLFRAYRENPALFGRDAATRRGEARARLREETGMTDEAVEGWALMLARNPLQKRRLETKLSLFRGVQAELAPTAWRASPAGSGAEDSGPDAGPSRGRGRGRAHHHGGGGRGGRGAVVGGPAAAGEETEQARRRKEANKGSRANHNRRDQRARKMARGGFPG